ncbi:hypothetical protein [Burkholderia ubonensis]|uniref:hypothetical protein n=1 Tax=Burkholderia ubonensis TaxID=101571 RepID=UPI000A4558C4|nr:hypothetical protein [Burkholderia ubonensis]
MTTDNENCRADALTDERRQALGEALADYFGKLDSDEGIRAPEGRIHRTFDYCDSRNIDDMIDRAIAPALAASPVEQSVTLTAQAALAAIETFEIVGENNDSREPNEEDRFILTEFIAHAFGGYPVEQHEAAPADARAHWKTATPPTKNGEHREYIVAVRRAHDNRRVFVFAASHANNYADELRDQDGNEFIADGWYDIAEDPSGEFNTMFTPTLGENDEILGWQELPKWSDTAVTQHLAQADARGEDAYVAKRLSEVLASIYTTLIGDDQADADESLNAIERVERAAQVLRLEVELYRGQADAQEGPTDEQRVEMTDAARDVLAERRRHVEQEGWTPAQDDKYRDHELSCAAGCYAMYTLAYPAGDPPPAWPWAAEWWKPTTHRRNLVKAGGLILAAIERLDRATAAAGERDAS